LHVTSLDDLKKKDGISRVNEKILNGTSAQLGYTVPFTSVHARKYGQKTN